VRTDDLMTDDGPVTTAGVIAVGNLEARIEGQLSREKGGPLTVCECAELVDLIALRGHVLGCISDLERAAAFADELVDHAPSDARSFLARAKMRGVFHRFAPALADLDTAASLGGDRVELDAERAATYTALGRYDEALAIRRLAVERHADFSSRAAVAAVYGERGDTAEAERWFTAATVCYRGSSPFPLAMLDFQRGRMWMEHDDLRRARAWCDAAVRRLSGLRARARTPRRARRGSCGDRRGNHPPSALALASDDPDYATQLARILRDAGEAEEAKLWRGRAEARYDELLACHRDAFADHAAEFWLGIGGDPVRARQLARHNLSLRQTARARALVHRSSGLPPGMPATA